MTESAFPPHIASALDRLRVPPLPIDFGDRLVERIETGDLPAADDSFIPPLPAIARRFGSAKGWRRSGRIVASVAALGIATATAAASGVFGEPVYIPVVSETLAKAQLVDMPRREKMEPQKLAPKAASPTEPQEADERKNTAKASVAFNNLAKRLRADPEFHNLPPRERLAVARGEVRRMLETGEITIPELRAALAERRMQRRGMRHERRQNLRPVEASTKQPPSPAKTAEPNPQVPPVSQTETLEANPRFIEQVPVEQRSRLRELRQALRAAPIAERPAIRQEIRDILRSAALPRTEKVDELGEGNPDTVR